MGRLRKVDAERERQVLAAAPTAARDWRPLVETLTEDPRKQEALIAELASLDELERSLRRYMLRGNAGAAANMLKAKKQRAELLRLAEPDAAPLAPDENDLVDWVPLDPEEDKKDLDAALEGVLTTEKVQ